MQCVHVSALSVRLETLIVHLASSRDLHLFNVHVHVQWCIMLCCRYASSSSGLWLTWGKYSRHSRENNPPPRYSPRTTRPGHRCTCQQCRQGRRQSPPMGIVLPAPRPPIAEPSQRSSRVDRRLDRSSHAVCEKPPPLRCVARRISVLVPAEWLAAPARGASSLVRGQSMTRR